MSRTRHHGRRNKEKAFGENWQWWRSEPKHHRRDCKHRPQRNKTKQALHKVMRGDEEVLFPLDKKPWIYWW